MRITKWRLFCRKRELETSHCLRDSCRAKNKSFKYENPYLGSQEEVAFYYAATHLHEAEVFSRHIRGHWGVENRNHHVRDVALREDASRIRVNPGIFARVRSFVLNILRFNQVENIQGTLYEAALDANQLLEYKGIT